jgi:DNA helicase-2/ATP-dependent DNA helicase PcrA
MKLLNIQQQIAVQAPERPLLIVAGAGTGKTKTLTNRISYLIDQGLSPEKICALTFTNKAAREMEERLSIEEKAGTGRKGTPFIGTFHSLGAGILRSEARLFGRTPSFVVFDDHDSGQLIKKIMKELGIEKSDVGPAFFRQKISHIKNGMIHQSELANSKRPQDELALEIFRRYEEALQKNNAFDFDDLIEKPVALFKGDAARRLTHQARFHHVLVDEYQDVNNMQYELIKLLVGPSHKLSVVGDDQQTIYSWRGSNFNIFLNFEKDWPNSQVVLLEENYRSSANIIQAATSVIQNNKKQKPKTLWTKNEPGSLVQMTETSDEENEAGWIIEQIIDRYIKNPDSLTETAILYRTNAQSRPIEQALLDRHIPYHIFGGLKFYERKEIKDIVAALRYQANPHDSVSRERLEKGLTKTRFNRFKNRLEANPDASPAEVIKMFLEEMDYMTYLAKHFTNNFERKENINELIHFAERFDSLTPLLEQIALVQSTDAPSNQKGEEAVQKTGVALMTLHMAKGLEFDHVYIAGCSEGLLPHGRSYEDEGGVEEERRLMYVGMTRARKNLAVSFYDMPSPFLSEIPSELVSFESLVSDRNELDDSEERYITLD